MKIRSAVPENGCLIVLVDGRKQKKQKNNCKTYTHLPPTGRRLRKLMSVLNVSFCRSYVQILIFDNWSFFQSGSAVSHCCRHYTSIVAVVGLW